MLKVILYGYSQKVYSCRGIEKLIKENIPAMWLSAMQQPDFRTLNDFRGQRLKGLMDELFESMILKLIEDNYITMENYFLDGTKIEADPISILSCGKNQRRILRKAKRENTRNTESH